jgi:hypothetical protein
MAYIVATFNKLSTFKSIKQNRKDNLISESNEMNLYEPSICKFKINIVTKSKVK